MAKVFNDDVFRICTHDGEYHADEVFAVAAYKLLVSMRGPGAAGSHPFQIRRSRKPEDFMWANVVIDVGQKLGVDEDGRSWFDHHQVEGGGNRPDETRNGRPCRGIPYAAFGLVWKAIGSAVVEGCLQVYKDLDPRMVDRVAKAVDQALVASVDAADNGLYLSADHELYGKVPYYSVSQVISAMNWTWDRGSPNGPQGLIGPVFDTAVHLASEILFRSIIRTAASMRGEVSVRAAYGTRDNPKILVLPSTAPWKRTLLEELQDKEVLYVIYPQDRTTPWMVEAVPDNQSARRLRKPFPESWGGCREDLSEVTGIEKLVFCHRNLFIAGARTFAAALALAEKAIQS